MTQPTVSDLCQAMEVIAPVQLAESWDNVGLLVGDGSAEVRRVLLCIDLTQAVLEEAIQKKVDAVIAYHPPIFKGVKRLRAGEVVFECIRRGIAIYSPHTALDVAEDGTNDVLCDLLEVTDRRPLRVTEATEEYKLTVFCPIDAVEAVADACFEAGAGIIGDYRQCSFRLKGHGTFFGDDNTNPTVGQAGRREEVEEIRLETVVPPGKVAAVVAALVEAHPYEEPAYDLLKRHVPAAVGLGRVGKLEKPVSREALLERIKTKLGLPHILVAGPATGAGDEVTRVAVCAGSCGDIWQDAAKAGAQVYVTGEMKHHDALAAAAAGLTVACVLHSNSERRTLDVLKARLGEQLANVDVLQSEADRDPFAVA